MRITLPPQHAVKVLCNGRSWHGGNHEWSLPTKNADGTWTPGDRTPSVLPTKCKKGWHLTLDPARWWGTDAGIVAYLAEYGGAVDAGDDKIAVEWCRLVRPLTSAELESAGIYASGSYEVREGVAWASGSANVTASGSATVTARDSANVTASGSANVRAWDSATVTASDSANVTASGSANVTASGSATVTAWDSATVTASDSANVRASGSANVTAWDSATVTASDSATVTARDSANVTASDSANVTASDSATVRAWDSANVTASGSANVTASDSATVRASGSANVTASGSATVRAWDSAKVHAGDYSTCIAWRGVTLVLTRSERGVIIDRRGGTVKTYTKKRGLDGWRYRDGKWTRRSA